MRYRKTIPGLLRGDRVEKVYSQVKGVFFLGDVNLPPANDNLILKSFSYSTGCINQKPVWIRTGKGLATRTTTSHQAISEDIRFQRHNYCACST